MVEESRKLASVQKIAAIKPIEGKDRIVLAQVEGWEVIVSKNFKVGDLCVYFEIDSILPDIPLFATIKKRSNLRIKTMKMGGVISQGFVISLQEVEQAAKAVKEKLPKKLKEGMNLTKILHVEKYEEDVMNNRQNAPKHSKFYKFFMRFGWFRKLVKGNSFDISWPEFIAKTDEIRWNNIIDKLKSYQEQGLIFQKTVKMDGQSATFLLDKLLKKGKWSFSVCSRNMRINPKDTKNEAFWNTAKKYKIQELLEYFRDTIIPDLHIGSDVQYICLQGEQCGPKIQKNRIGLLQNKLYVFNLIIKTEAGLFKLNPEQFKETFYRFSQLETVPYLGETKLKEITPEWFAEQSFGYYDESRGLIREGVVFRNYEHDISFKAVSEKYLLKHGI